MKTSRPKTRPKTYICRKCLRTDFKSPIEFTNHLRNCRGPIPKVVSTPTSAAPALAPVPVVSNGKGLRQELVRLRTLGIEVRDLAEKLLRQVK